MSRLPDAFRFVALMASLTMAFTGPAVARDLPFARYAQEARALMALTIAVQELTGCESPLEFREEDVAGSNGTLVRAVVTCPRFPASGGPKPASVKIELGIDDKKIPIGPTSFDYDLP